jgi:hypothetical protein
MKITLSLVLIFLAGYVFARYFPQIGRMVGLP